MAKAKQSKAAAALAKLENAPTTVEVVNTIKLNKTDLVELAYEECMQVLDAEVDAAEVLVKPLEDVAYKAFKAAVEKMVGRPVKLEEDDCSYSRECLLSWHPSDSGRERKVNVEFELKIAGGEIWCHGEIPFPEDVLPSFIEAQAARKTVNDLEGKRQEMKSRKGRFKANVIKSMLNETGEGQDLVAKIRSMAKQMVSNTK